MNEGLVGVSFLLPLQFDLTATFLAAIAATSAACRRGMQTERAAWIAIFLTIAMRLAAIRFNWTTHAVGSALRGRGDRKDG